MGSYSTYFNLKVLILRIYQSMTLHKVIRTPSAHFVKYPPKNLTDISNFFPADAPIASFWFMYVKWYEKLHQEFRASWSVSLSNKFKLFTFLLTFKHKIPAAEPYCYSVSWKDDLGNVGSSWSFNIYAYSIWWQMEKLVPFENAILIEQMKWSITIGFFMTHPHIWNKVLQGK